MTQIPPSVFYNLLVSTACLNYVYGETFNTMVTLNYEQLGVADLSDRANALTKLNKSIDAWLQSGARKNLGVEAVHHYLYVHENCKSFGVHVHMAMVLPDFLKHEFNSWLKSWIARNYPNGDKERAIVASTRIASMYDWKTRTDNQARIVRYLLKTSKPIPGNDRNGKPVLVQECLGIRVGQASQPFKVGRMAGVSQHLNKSQWSKINLSQKWHWEDYLTETPLRANFVEASGRKLTEQLNAIDI